MKPRGLCSMKCACMNNCSTIIKGSFTGEITYYLMKKKYITKCTVENRSAIDHTNLSLSVTRPLTSRGKVVHLWHSNLKRVASTVIFTLLSSIHGFGQSLKKAFMTCLLRNHTCSRTDSMLRGCRLLKPNLGHVCSSRSSLCQRPTRIFGLNSCGTNPTRRGIVLTSLI